MLIDAQLVTPVSKMILDMFMERVSAFVFVSLLWSLEV